MRGRRAVPGHGGGPDLGARDLGPASRRGHRATPAPGPRPRRRAGRLRGDGRLLRLDIGLGARPGAAAGADERGGAGTGRGGVPRGRVLSRPRLSRDHRVPARGVGGRRHTERLDRDPRGPRSPAGRGTAPPGPGLVRGRADRAARARLGRAVCGTRCHRSRLRLRRHRFRHRAGRDHRGGHRPERAPGGGTPPRLHRPPHRARQPPRDRRPAGRGAGGPPRPGHRRQPRRLRHQRPQARQRRTRPRRPATGCWSASAASCPCAARC